MYAVSATIYLLVKLFAYNPVQMAQADWLSKIQLRLVVV